MFAVVDRIEQTTAGEPLAVLCFDDAQHLIVPLSELPPGAGEGVVLSVAWVIDAAETGRREARVRVLQRHAFGEH